MATTMGFQPYDTGGVITRYLPAGTNATFHKGDAVTVTTGLVVICTDDQSVFGVAAADHAATGVALQMTPVYLADPSVIWVGEVDGTSIVTDVGTSYGLNLTSQQMSIDQDDTTTTSVRVIDIHPVDGYKALGRVLFCWRTKAIQGDGAA